ncbi:exosome complex protein Rrp42 [Candidatus Woesearchaeota archaeon]|nr:exosome complex protein Rrp42 [Candidatus Woesearchaeota archaeon]
MTSHTGEHVKELVKKGKRIDGRTFDQFREIVIEPGINECANGSCRVKFGDTELLVGIKMEMGKPYPDTPDQGAMMVGAELLPLSNPKYESGPPGIDSIELARVVDRGIRESKAIDVNQLCIEPGEKCWIVTIDIVPLNSNGNLFDAAGIGAIAALKNAVLPRYEDGILYPREKADQKLPIKNTPVPITVSKIADNLMIDLLEDEEEAVDARLTVATLEDGTICAMQKGGDAPLTTDEIANMVDLATEKAIELRSKLED